VVPEIFYLACRVAGQSVSVLEYVVLHHVLDSCGQRELSIECLYPWRWILCDPTSAVLVK